MNQNYFPKTTGYLVNWLGGSGGGFITVLIYFYFTQVVEKIPINEHGKAHHIINYLKLNFKTKSQYSNNQLLHNIPIYKTVYPIDETKPILLFDHFPCDPHDFFSIYPNCKIISISIDKDDRQLIYGNLFFKEGDTLFRNARELKEYNSQYEVPADVLQTFFNKASTGVFKKAVPTIFDINVPVPECFKNKIHQLEFKKIIRDKEYILYNLSTITGKSPPIGVIDFIDEYLDKQKKLVETRMPWLLDYFYLQ